MTTYDNYKESGIEWLGDIPQHWDDSHLKRVCKLIKDGTHGSFKRVDVGFPLLSVRNIVNNKFTNLDDDSLISKEDYLSIIKSFRIKEGDLQMAIVGATMGKIAIVPKLSPFATQRSIATIRTANKILLNTYLFYFIQGIKFQTNLWANTNYSAQPGIYLGTIERINIFVPPLPEQTAISSYLDTKTQAIDKKIDLLSKKANTYKDLRKSIINETVCRGLDKNVVLKDSGIEWIGLIPQLWEVKRIKDSFNLFTGNSISDKGLFEIKEESIDYISTKDIDVNTGEICYDNGLYIPKKDKSFKVSKANSTLICIEGANAGKKIGFAIKDLCFVNKLCSIKSFKKSDFDKYFYYYTQSVLFEKQFFSVLNGLIGGVSLSVMRYFDTISPPLQEQIAIANYLDEKTQKIDAIVLNIEKQIEALKELRKTLINDVVTGKIKITE